MLTPEQKELRKHGIGSSEIAAVCGMSQWQTPTDVWMVKTDRKDDFEGNEATETGDWLEDKIAKRYSEKTGIEVNHGKPITHIHKDHIWALATPDRFLGNGKILEIKNVGPNACRYWDDSTADGVPLYVWAQVQWQMFVMRTIKQATVCALLGGVRLRWWEFDYDQIKSKQMFKIAERFWHENVLADVAPDETDPEYLKLTFPTDSGKVLEATETIIGLAKDRVIADTNWKAAKAERDKIDNQLKAIIGPASSIEGVCTYKADKNGRRNIKFNYRGE